jgi:hypothetical protein
MTELPLPAMHRSQVHHVVYKTLLVNSFHKLLNQITQPARSLKVINDMILQGMEFKLLD